jgi:protoporphyrin/coproporphyrin ferrochelatase
MPNEQSAVLLMAYGTPETPEQVEPYFTHIRGGRSPSAEAVQDLQRRYAAVGGATPLLEITRQVARSLETRVGQPVYVGMKHWHPFIGETIPRIAADGIRRVTAIVLAPHYSRMSIGGYRKAVDEANAKLTDPLEIRFVESWHLQPSFIELIAQRIRHSLEEFAPNVRDRVLVVFSAHSLPVRIREWNDPYESQLTASCAAVAECAGLSRWEFAWQSAGGSTEPWLGPDLLEVLETVRANGVEHVLSVPIGFLSDHLEVLYDIDLEAQEKARELGIELRRTPMPNADPALIETLAELVERAEQ